GVIMFGAWWGWFTLGLVVGALIALWIVIWELVDDVTRRFVNGAGGEEMTAAELRRCTRLGWRSVHNVVLEAGDIDHIAVGPGGVVVIETKNPDAGWDWLHRNGVHEPWVRQAKRAALRASALIRQH